MLAKAAKKTAKRREWTTADVREMKKLARTKIGTAKIARKLKRTPGALAVKAASLGVSLSMR